MGKSEQIKNYYTDIQFDMLTIKVRDQESLILMNGIFIMINLVTFCLFLTFFSSVSRVETSNMAVI